MCEPVDAMMYLTQWGRVKYFPANMNTLTHTMQNQVD